MSSFVSVCHASWRLAHPLGRFFVKEGEVKATITQETRLTHFQLIDHQGQGASGYRPIIVVSGSNMAFMHHGVNYIALWAPAYNDVVQEIAEKHSLPKHCTGLITIYVFHCTPYDHFEYVRNRLQSLRLLEDRKCMWPK